MMDPNWARGFYYDKIPPHVGMKLAREIATVTYRSGPEWEQRFGRQRADPSRQPALCPDFLIETYLDHAGEKFCLEYDANSLLYVSKAMDLFDLGAENRRSTAKRREENAEKIAAGTSYPKSAESCNLTLPETPYQEQPSSSPNPNAPITPFSGSPPDLLAGLSPLRQLPALCLRVCSATILAAWRPRAIA